MAVDLVLLNNKPALMLYFIVGLKNKIFFLFIFFKLFMYFCLLIIYKNNKKKEKNKKSLQIIYKKTYKLILFNNIIN
jgi:hypothetical protein